MNLNEYLDAMKKCPDDQLTKRLVGDNLKILVEKAHYDLRALVMTAPFMAFQEDRLGASEFFYVPGTVIMDVRDEAKVWDTRSPRVKPYHEIIKLKYKSMLSFHTEQGENKPMYKRKDNGKKLAGVHEDRAVANCVEEMVNLLIISKFSFCIDDVRFKQEWDNPDLIIWYPKRPEIKK
ncbi:MAG: hypothetical protein WCP89_01245 [archaeon]